MMLRKGYSTSDLGSGELKQGHTLSTESTVSNASSGVKQGHKSSDASSSAVSRRASERPASSVRSHLRKRQP